LVSFKDQLVLEASMSNSNLDQQELSKKIVSIIQRQIVPRAILNAKLPELPSPASVKMEELRAKRYGRYATKHLLEKTTFIQDMEKLRYQWNGSNSTDSELPIDPEEKIPVKIKWKPKNEMELGKSEKPSSVEAEIMSDVSPAPSGDSEEEMNHKLIEFDVNVTEKVVTTPSYADFMAKLESMIRQNYGTVSGSFHFSIKAVEDFQNKEKTTITITLPDTTFDQKMEFWNKIEMNIQKTIDTLEFTDEEKMDVSKSLFTCVQSD
jgi:hypothetical protein